ncbi:DUF4082 domain-containing protein [Micromonospora sp. FIMYZ51]|uniref:DUF4082 domain-containing protein n=1 Tax=Micromonospora sp. FIMYZ51 TaxID=3051832 RepID=UPI00311E7357
MAISAVSAAEEIDPCNPVLNPIVCENSKEGTPSAMWDVPWGDDESIQGFATEMSVNLGERIDFKIKTDATDYRIDIYRLGYYGGAGARRIAELAPLVPLPQVQPECVSDPSTNLVDCGNWAVSAFWNVPATAVSGVYVARLTRTDTGRASHITFVIRDDASTSDLFFQTSDTTWQAYNSYGGANLYPGPLGRAHKISYNRPFATRRDASRDFLFSNEYPMLRFLERNGYDISYTTGVDSDRRGALIRNHKVFISTGHDEYWSGAQRANVEAARDAGVSLAFFSGNDVYWRTRWEPSVDGSDTPHRTLVCYKETWANERIEDTPQEWTGTWRDPRFSTPTNGGGRPENALIGTAYMANFTDLPLQVPAEQGQYRFWRNAGLPTTGTATLAPHIVGYESNEDLDNGFRPPGLIRLSTTVGPTPEYLQDFGSETAAGTTTHHATLYRAPSGALVFSAGTIQWAWGLDTYHDGVRSPVSRPMQQATVNLFGDMGVQPDTLMTDLAPATSSTDTEAPTVAITSPAAVTTVTNGSKVTVRGTAADTGGGRVAGVEVSTDGGTTWHPATGTTNWEYEFYTAGIGAQVVHVRAIDDSVNIGSALESRLFNLSGPSTLFGARVPQTAAADDSTSVELGIRFRPQVDGLITGIRFYKGPGNTGTHTGSLWTAGGRLLAGGTFTGETSTGWQTLTFSRPAEVSAGTTYVASYHAPNGHYAADEYYLSLADHLAGPLIAPHSRLDEPNGVYKYGAGFPESPSSATNYYVDVRFVASEDAPPMVVATTPVDNATGVPLDSTLSVVFSKAVAPSTIQFTLRDADGDPVAGDTSYHSSTRTATFTPTEELQSAQRYTASVTAEDTRGNASDPPTEWSFTVDLDPSVVRLFAADAVPTNPAVSDGGGAVELGVKFTAAVSGTVLGLRFYQGPGNTGAHTGTLWSTSGEPLRQVTFGPKSGLGWQTAAFADPYPVSAGTTYVVSYFAPNGNYAYDPGFFDTPWTNGLLSAPSNGNGVFRYGSPGFPTDWYQNANYWVDPLFKPGEGPTPSAPPSPTPSRTPSPTPSATPSPTPSATPSATPLVTSSPTSSAPPSPTASPTPSTTPTPTPSGPVSPPTGVNLFTGSGAPQVTSWNDSDALEVGVAFRSDVAGKVTGVRFWQGSGNTGVHTGSLWSASGERLTSATFVNETGSGWQSVRFPEPVPITAGTTYVVSYHTTTGRYAVSLAAFQSAELVTGPLRVSANGGRYRYGPSAFPNRSSQHNYWVDVFFQANGP